MLMFRWTLILVTGWTLAAAWGDTPPPGASPPTGAEETEGEAAGDAEAGRETGQEQADAASEAPPLRLYLIVNRHQEAWGRLELEDDDVLVLRTPNGELETYIKARVLEIIQLVNPQPGQTGFVVMRDGQIHEGVIIEDAYKHVVVEIEGIRTKLPRHVVHHVILEPMFQKRYEAYREALRPGMHEEHLGLCRWLVHEHRYKLAREELLRLLELKDMPEARQLLRVVQAQLALGQAEEEDVSEADEAAQAGGGENDATDDLPDEIISREDVNLIRVYEIDFRRPPRVLVPKETIRQLIERYGTSKLIPASQSERMAMYHADPLRLARLMFELRARDLYPQIRVLNEPYALNLFRQRVHDTWLVSNCATSRCHGGPDGGRFYLHRRRHHDERVRMTNFLILERLTLDAEWPLINYDDPEMSLVIQYGLPRTEARLPHPDVRGWRPAFRTGRDRLKRDAVQWIRAMMQPRPEYPVEYEPPVLGASDGGGEGDGPAEGQRAPR